MLKWTGALAGAAIVGGAAVYAAQYKAPPPPPPSFKPPLSADVQTAVDGIISNLIARHAGETVVYGGCSCNCGGAGCMAQYHTKNGVLTCVEPEQIYHVGTGMEDKVMTQREFDHGLFNRRGCPIIYGYTNHLNSPDRVLYPIERAPGTPRGGGQWVRSDWTTCLNKIATNMKQLKDQYGPFFLLNPYGSTDGGASTVMRIYQCGTTGYGLCSDDVGRITGPFSGLTGFAFSTSPGNDIQDALKYAKVMILQGMTHFTTRYGGGGYAAGWYRRLAREKGTPIIQIDPKYTWDAEVAADQWIPIKPGTDTAMLFAIAYVLITENLTNPTFYNQWLRDIDYTAQANYILGKGGKGVPFTGGITGNDQNLPGFQNTGFAPDYTNYDTIPKTPQWAESICGIPADTITALAHLLANNRPGILMRHYGVTRKSYGEYGLKMAIWIQILLGNAPLVHGGFGSNGTQTRSVSLSMGSAGSAPSTSTYSTPTFYRAFHWWKAVSYGVRVLTGGASILQAPPAKMTWNEWSQIVGFNADPAFLTMFNPKMLWGNASNQVVMGENSNAQIRAMCDPAVVFSFHQHTRITSTGKYTDMILPITDGTFESGSFGGGSYGGFDCTEWNLDLNLAVGTPRPGQVWDSNKVCAGILNGLGGLALAQQISLAWTGDGSTYEAAINAAKKTGWTTGGYAFLQSHGVANPPTYDTVVAARQGLGVTRFNPSEFYTVGPSADTFNGYNISGIAYTIDTKSGKFEHYWDGGGVTGPTGGGVTDNTTRGQRHYDFKNRQYAHMPNDWKDLQPISVYHPCFNGMEDYPKLTGNGLPRLATYPLMILTTNTRVSTHYLMRDPGNPRTRDTIRHSLIISATDAKARGIKDNDVVRVFNDQGQVAVRAYVTNRLLPGTVQLRTGEGPNYGPNTASSGWNGQRLDMNLGPQTLMGGCVNQFTGGDDISPITPAKVTNSVQVELYAPDEVL